MGYLFRLRTRQRQRHLTTSGNIPARSRIGDWSLRAGEGLTLALGGVLDLPLCLRRRRSPTITTLSTGSSPLTCTGTFAARRLVRTSARTAR